MQNLKVVENELVPVHETGHESKWYRKKIVEMVNQIENEDYVFKIYHYILAKYKREKGVFYAKFKGN